MKDAGLRIRVQRELRDQFLAACRTEDKPAAQVIREFMRAYVREKQNGIEAGAAAVAKEQRLIGKE